MPERGAAIRNEPNCALKPPGEPSAPGGSCIWYPESKFGLRPTPPEGPDWGRGIATGCNRAAKATHYRPPRAPGTSRAHPNAPRGIAERHLHATRRSSPYFGRPLLGPGAVHTAAINEVHPSAGRI
jgi:hypothetical protein